MFEESAARRLSAPAYWLCAISDIGKRRSRNEDGYFLSTDCKLWVVTDGMGGHAAGELASTLTIEAIADVMDATGRMAGPDMNPGHSLIEAFILAQERVMARVHKDAASQGMGSTAIAGVIEGDALYVCHVGDTRAYRYSQRRLRLLTNDHSVVWELVMAELMTPEQARRHPQRTRITQAIGMQTGIQPEVTAVALIPGDRILLCSDGLWEALGDQEIGRIMGSSGSMLELASILVDKANALSGRDNITAVLYEHGSSQLTSDGKPPH